MADENNTPKSSPEYAMLPAGTVVKFGEVGAAVAALKPLINCKALGATGQTGGFVDCTTLLDKSKQSVSDLPEGPEKSLGVQFYVELPNKRTASMILALSGWQMNEITAPASEVIQITVQGKQNNIKWGIAAPAPDAGV